MTTLINGQPTVEIHVRAGIEGADTAGTAAGIMAEHEAAEDPHGQYALESSLGTAAAADTTDFEAGGALAGHLAEEDPHPQYALFANLGTAAVANAEDFAPNSPSYIVFDSAEGVDQARVLTAGSGITLTDAGAGSTLTIAASGGGSGGGPAQAPPIGATYWWPGLTLTGYGNASIFANYIYLCQFVVTTETDFTGLAVYVGAGVGGSNVRLGIYNASDTWAATTIVVDSGAISTATGGIKTYAGSFTLPPGNYYTAILADANPTILWFATAGGVGGTACDGTGYRLFGPGAFFASQSYGALLNNPSVVRGASPSGCPVLLKVA